MVVEGPWRSWAEAGAVTPQTEVRRGSATQDKYRQSKALRMNEMNANSKTVHLRPRVNVQ